MNLIQMIKAAKEQQWDAIDAQIPAVCDKPTYKRWASDKGIKSTNDDVRDLAVSLLEKTKELPAGVREKLLGLMARDPYDIVRYRSAFALAAHGDRYYTDEVRAVINEALQNKDVGEIAKQYLRKKG